MHPSHCGCVGALLAAPFGQGEPASTQLSAGFDLAQDGACFYIPDGHAKLPDAGRRGLAHD